MCLQHLSNFRGGEPYRTPCLHHALSFSAAYLEKYEVYDVVKDFECLHKLALSLYFLQIHLFLGLNVMYLFCFPLRNLPKFDMQILIPTLQS